MSSFLFPSYEAAGLEQAANDRYGSRARKDYTCPKCSADRKPQNRKIKCLSVDFAQGVWNCHHCAWKGRLRTESDDEAQRRREQAQAQRQYVRPVLRNATQVSNRGLVWFEHERHISRATVEAFGIVEQECWMPAAYRRGLEQATEDLPNGTEEERNQRALQLARVPALLFPYHRGGEVINVKYRSRDEKDFRLAKNAELIFFNLDAVATETTCLIVEGEMDALAWHEAGVKNVISVPNGTALSVAERREFERTGQFDPNKPLQLEYLDNCWDDLTHIETFYIATDADAPGVKLRTELLRRLGGQRCRLVSYPKGCKDANDVLRIFGKDALRACQANATIPPVDGALRVDDVWDAMLHLLEYGSAPGLPLGIDEFKKHFSLRLGELTIVGGVPGDGKTTFVKWLVCLTSLLYGWKWAIFSPENYPEEKMFLALAQVLIGKPVSPKYGGRMTPEELSTWREFMRSHFFVLDVNKVTTPASVVAMAEGLAQRHGVNALLIDPWNSLHHSVPAGANKADYLTAELSRVREFNRRYNAATFINAHPVKQHKNESGTYNVVGPYDLADGAAWYNRADNIISVHRRRTSSFDLTTDVHVQKVKFHDEVGVPTQPSDPVILEYEPATARFHGWVSRTAPEPFRASVITAPLAPKVAEPTHPRLVLLGASTFEQQGVKQNAFAFALPPDDSDPGF